VKPYILVSLWAPDDDATQLSHAFAERFHARRSAVRFVHGAAPSHDELRTAAEACPGAALVLFAHGGPALAAHRGGDAWIRPHDLAAIASGRRVYAFACSTFVPQPRLGLHNFATLAVDACVDVFVGHEAPVMTPFAGEGSEAHAGQRMDDALFALIERFVEGEDDARELVNIGRMYASWDEEVELDLVNEDEGAPSWSSAIFLGGYFKSLRVSSKVQI
jgi:hypothetical protein